MIFIWAINPTERKWKKMISALYSLWYLIISNFARIYFSHFLNGGCIQNMGVAHQLMGLVQGQRFSLLGTSQSDFCGPPNLFSMCNPKEQKQNLFYTAKGKSGDSCCSFFPLQAIPDWPQKHLCDTPRLPVHLSYFPGSLHTC